MGRLSIVNVVCVSVNCQYLSDADDWKKPWVWDCESYSIRMGDIAQRR